MTRRLDLAMLLVLTFSTGMVDAIGYLGFDKVFTGKMTGNVVILGMGLAGAEDTPVLRPALALVFFMVGAALGGRVLGAIGEAWHARTTTIYASVAIGCAGLSCSTSHSCPTLRWGWPARSSPRCSPPSWARRRPRHGG